MMQLAKTQTAFATSTTTRASALRTSAVPRPTTRRTVVVFAIDNDKPESPTVERPSVPKPIEKSIEKATEAADKAANNFVPVMAFSGIGPETINGRLAMVGFVAAVAAELSSEEPVLVQWASAPLYVAGAFLLVIVGSLIPFLQGDRNTERVGPLTPSAEMTNGRAAMIGFAALLVCEWLLSGKPLF